MPAEQGNTPGHDPCGGFPFRDGPGGSEDGIGRPVGWRGEAQHLVQKTCSRPSSRFRIETASTTPPPSMERYYHSTSRDRLLFVSTLVRAQRGAVVCGPRAFRTPVNGVENRQCERIDDVREAARRESADPRRTHDHGGIGVYLLFLRLTCFAIVIDEAFDVCRRYIEHVCILTRASWWGESVPQPVERSSLQRSKRHTTPVREGHQLLIQVNKLRDVSHA